MLPVRTLLALGVLVTLVAGCLGGPGDDAEDDLLVPPPPFLRVKSIVDDRGGQGEPSLGVTADGVLFANGPAHEGRPDPGAAFRSTDGGATWEQVGTPTAPYPNFDPDLAVDLDGNVWFDTLWLGCATVSVSRDQGETWSDPNPAACTGPGGDRQYVIPTAGGEAFVYYHQLPTFQQTAARTSDYGKTWVPTAPVEPVGHHLFLNEGSGWGGGGFWDPVHDAVYFTFSWSRSDGTWFPAYAVTHDDGASWTIGFAGETEGRGIGLSLVVGAADEAGSVYIAWAEQFGSGEEAETRVYLGVSTDDGKTWNEKIRLDATANSKVFPAITAGAAGEVAVAYYEADRRGTAGGLPVDAKWNVTLAWTQDVLAPAPHFQHAEFSNGTVKEGRICPSGTGCEGDREFLDYFQIERLPDGRIGGVYNSLLAVEDETATVYSATEGPLLSPWSW